MTHTAGRPLMRIRSAFVRLFLATLVALLPAARQASAQESGVPQEETVAELRDTL